VPLTTPDTDPQKPLPAPWPAGRPAGTLAVMKFRVPPGLDAGPAAEPPTGANIPTNDVRAAATATARSKRRRDVMSAGGTEKTTLVAIDEGARQLGRVGATGGLTTRQRIGNDYPTG
jgi:hypothetical protein